MVIAIKIMMKGIVKVAADWDDIADYSSAFNGKITGCGIIA
jgi:hypothetical protein